MDKPIPPESKFLLVLVTSESMQPSVPRGSLVLVDSTAHDPKQGDVIVYQRAGGFVIHRVLAAGSNAVLEKGDNSNAHPLFVNKANLVGTAISVKLAGSSEFEPLNTTSLLDRLFLFG